MQSMTTKQEICSTRKRIVDTHQHVFWHGRDDQGLVNDMNAHGIEYAWLLTWEIATWEDQAEYHPLLNPMNRRSDGTHAGITLRDLVTARDRFPSRFVLGYCPHPLLGDAPGLLRAAVAMYGVQVCGEWKATAPCDDPRSLELFHAAGELKLPVVLHLDVPYLCNAEGKRVYQPLWYGGTVENLARALAACPETVFIGHGPGFWREISADADQSPKIYPEGPVVGPGKLYDLFDRWPNLRADLSGTSGLNALRRDPAHARAFVARYSDRLLFGRDTYGQDLHTFLETLDLAQDAWDNIYWAVAEKLVAARS